jgi:hypothetical protein
MPYSMSLEQEQPKIPAGTDVKTEPGSVVEREGYTAEKKVKILGLAGFLGLTSIILYENSQGRSVDPYLYLAAGASLVLVGL